MVAFIEEHYNEITLKDSTSQISTIKTDALMDLVPILRCTINKI